MKATTRPKSHLRYSFENVETKDLTKFFSLFLSKTRVGVATGLLEAYCSLEVRTNDNAFTVQEFANEEPLEGIQEHRIRRVIYDLEKMGLFRELESKRLRGDSHYELTVERCAKKMAELPSAIRKGYKTFHLKYKDKDGN